MFNSDQDHIADKGNNSVYLDGFVHTPEMTQADESTRCQKPRRAQPYIKNTLPAWDISKVPDKEDVTNEAQVQKISVHSTTLMDLCNLKHSQLAEHLKTCKGKVVLRGDNDKDDFSRKTAFAEHGAPASRMTAATALTQHPNVWSSERRGIGLHTSQNEVSSQIGQASPRRTAPEFGYGSGEIVVQQTGITSLECVYSHRNKQLILVSGRRRHQQGPWPFWLKSLWVIHGALSQDEIASGPNRFVRAFGQCVGRISMSVVLMSFKKALSFCAVELTLWGLPSREEVS